MADPIVLQTLPRYPAAPVTAVVCPYLLAEDGAWRSSSPARDHRCTAVVPPAPLTAEKQRRLCLVADHRSCATFQAATGAGEVGAISATAVHRTGRPTRAMARTTPLVLDHGRIALGIPALRGQGRGIGQGAIVGLMAVAFVLLVLPRLATGNGSPAPSDGRLAGAGQGSPSHAPATKHPAASASTPTAAPSHTLVPTEVQPTAKPTKTPAPTVAPVVVPATYKVRSGDTLSGIAARFQTTVRALVRLNGIKDPGHLRVGQELRLR
jgi:LysM repeat protein